MPDGAPAWYERAKEAYIAVVYDTGGFGPVEQGHLALTVKPPNRGMPVWTMVATKPRIYSWRDNFGRGGPSVDEQLVGQGAMRDVELMHKLIVSLGWTCVRNCQGIERHYERK